MTAAVRLFAAIGTFFGAWLAVFLIGIETGVTDWLLGPAGLIAGIWAARRVWRNFDGASDGAAVSMAMGAATLGGLGFVGGFFGPMIWASDANQGPLLGIFITGPVGALAGWVAWRRRQR